MQRSNDSIEGHKNSEENGTTLNVKFLAQTWEISEPACVLPSTKVVVPLELER